MPKYYYTDPLKVAWMSKEFKINFQIPHSYKEEDYGMLNVMALQVDASDDGTAHYIEAERDNSDSFVFEGQHEEDRYSGNYYIHPDCHEMLVPQIGDLLKTAYAHHDEYFLYRTEEDLKKRYGKGDIIQRNGKAFFMPEIENT